MGSKTAGGGLIQIFSAACLVLCNGWTLEQFQPQQGKWLYAFQRTLCNTALCREAVGEGERERRLGEQMSVLEM